MNLKRYKDFIIESKEDKFKFNFSFEEKCIKCKGSKIEEVECDECKGNGIKVYWEYDNYGNANSFDGDCNECDGNGTIEDDCSECNGVGKLRWTLEHVVGEGIQKMYGEYGNVDQPIQYNNGKISYNFPGMFPLEIKDITQHIFDNKNLSIKELVNSVVVYMFENKYINTFKINNNMINLLTDKSKNLIKSSNSINKFKL